MARRNRVDGWNNEAFAAFRKRFSEHYAKFAAAVGVSEQSVRNWEYMPRGPTGKSLIRIFRVLKKHFGLSYEKIAEELLTMPAKPKKKKR